MDKENKNNSQNTINHLMKNKTKDSKNEISNHNSKKNISEIDEKLTPISKKTLNDDDYSSISDNKQNNNDVFYCNIQFSKSIKSIKTEKSNRKNENTINFSSKKNAQKKNIINSIFNKSIDQSSNKINDNSSSFLLKKENESQEIISTIINKKIKNKKVPIFIERGKQKSGPLLKTKNNLVSNRRKSNKSDNSYGILKRRKTKSRTFMDLKFDKNILLDILNKKPESKFKENIVNIIAMDKVYKNLKKTISKIDKNELKKKLHDFETNEICDAIDKLPDNSFCITNNNPENNSNKAKNINVKNMENLDSKQKLIYYLQKYRCLEHKNLIYDSFDDEESDNAEIYSINISPNSKLVYIIDSIVLISSFIQVFYLPIFLANNINYCRNIFGINKIMFYCIDIIYVIDLITEFFRSYYNFEEILVNKKIEICKNYMNGWFLIDLIEAIPFYIILHIMENDCKSNTLYQSKYNGDFNKLKYILLIFKTFKIFKVISKNKTLNKIEELLEEIDFLLINENVFFTILLLFISIHISACLFIFLGRNSYPNWIIKYNLQNESFINIYTTTFYYLITTMTTVGYGDIIISSTLTEVFFQIFVLIVGTIFYSWIVTYVSNYIQKNNEKYYDYEQKMSILEDIKLSHPKLSKDLYKKIKRYLRYNKFKKKNNSEILIDCLPYTLKNILFLEMYKPVIQNFNLLKSVENSSFIVKIVTSFKLCLSIKGDILIQEGDLLEDIIFVKKGILSLEVGINMNSIKESIQTHLNYFNIKNENTKLNNTKIKNIQNNHSFNSDNNKFSNNFNETCIQVNKNLTEIVANNNNIKYIKIICIRKNEHFGDILMFLNKKAPFNVKVKSKTAELFYLSKTDAIEISTLYPNIWNRVIKNSLHNMKKINQVAKKILLVFSKINGIILNDKINNNKTEKEYKFPKSINAIDKKSQAKKKKNKKIKFIDCEKKKQENNTYSFGENNKYSTINNDNKITTNEKINRQKIDDNLNSNNYSENEKIEEQDITNISAEIKIKEINNNDQNNNVKNSDEKFESSLFQDRTINCELYPNEKLNENKFLKSDPSSDQEKEFINFKKTINNYEDNKLNKTKKDKRFFKDLSISQIQNITIFSSYDNLNALTKYNFYKDLNLQDKIKQFLLDECFPNKLISLSYDKRSAKNKLKILKTNDSFNNNKSLKNSIIRNDKSPNLLSVNNIINNENNPQLIDFNFKKHSRSSSKKDKLKNRFHSNKSIRPINFQKKSFIFKSSSYTNLIKINNMNTNGFDEKKEGKYFKNNFSKFSNKYTSPLIRGKLANNNSPNEKKKINYLDVISHNIYEDRQTLKNPCEFYAGFFANILEKQKNDFKKSKIISKSHEYSNFKEKIIDKNKTVIETENNLNNFYSIKDNSILKSNSKGTIE